MKLISLTVAVFLALQTYARATTIIVLWDPSYIVIGADSKLFFGKGFESKSICKIGVTRNVIWSADGYLTYFDRYSIGDIFKEEMDKNLPIEQTVGNISDRFFVWLSSILESEMTIDSSKFDAIKDNLAIEAVFGYFETGKVNIYRIQVRLPPNARPNDKFVKETVRCAAVKDPKCESGFFPMGKSEVITAEISPSGAIPILKRFGVQGAIDHFVDEESRANQDTVGAPVAILGLTSGGGVRWLEKGQCDNAPFHYTCADPSDRTCLPQ
jgi:hypothetical protein